MDNVDRIEESKVPSEEFIQKYEKPYKPVIIQGVQNGWKAQYKWTIEVHNYQTLYCIINVLPNCITVLFENIEVNKEIQESKV